MTKTSSINQIINDARKGKMFILVDNKDRENEGDLVIPASKINPKKIKLSGKSWYIDFSLEKKFKKYLINKGSVGVNGVSLTIAKVKKNVFQVVVIPHSLKLTNLIKLQEKDLVNIEFDILLKYIKNN